MKIATRQTLSVILAIAGSVGTLLTAILAVKATQKVMRQEEDLKNSKSEATSKKEVDALASGNKDAKKELLKRALPVYVPTILVGVATTASTISSTLLSRKTEMSLTAMAVLADQGWRKYKGKVISTLGLEKHLGVLSEVSKDDFKHTKPVLGGDGRELYWIEQIGFFKAFPEKIALAYGDLNQRMHTVDYGNLTNFNATLCDFIEDANAEILNKNISNEALMWGWSADYLKEVSGYEWVHMEYHLEKTDDGKEYTEIIFTEEPILNPGNYGEYFLSDESDVNTDYPEKETTFLKAGSGDK